MPWFDVIRVICNRESPLKHMSGGRLVVGALRLLTQQCDECVIDHLSGMCYFISFMQNCYLVICNFATEAKSLVHSITIVTT